MTLTKILPLLTFAFSVTTVSLAQLSSSTLPTVTPPSPNAHAFAKYGNTPVSPYTGVPNIQIPIFNIKSRDIELPISLSYHASGIKVGDEASRVGLGWVLNAGGIITRNIMYLDDLQALPDHYLDANNNSPDIPDGHTKPAADWVQSGDISVSSAGVSQGPIYYKHFDTQGPSGVVTQINVTNYVQGLGIDPFFKPYDFEPDQFNYNLPGQAGKFTLGRNIINSEREVFLERQEKIRIKYIKETMTFEITTADGFVYNFNDSEAYVENVNTPGYQQKTAWYLTQIQSPRGEIINFVYDVFPTQYIKTNGHFYERSVPMVLNCVSNYACKGVPSTSAQIPGKNYSNVALREIQWANGKVKINYANDRLDITGDKRITSLEIFEKNATAPYQEVVFEHEYFANPTISGGFATEFPDKALKRLKLKGITRRALPDTGEQPERHVFEYYETLFPAKNSYARDHWGYFNNRFNNSSLLPSFSYVNTTEPKTSTLLGIMGPEREPANGDIMAGLSLKSITYPTSGKTTFYYESNDFDITEGGIIPNESAETYSHTTSFVYNSNNKGTVQSTPFDLTAQYVNQQGKTVPVQMSGSFRAVVPCNAVTGTPDVYFKLVNASGFSYDVITPNGPRCTDPSDPNCASADNSTCVRCCNNSIVFEVKRTFLLPPGQYYWQAFMTSGEAQIIDIVASYTWLVDATKRPQINAEPDGSIGMYKLAGGLRIRKIEDYDPDADRKYNVRTFDYRYKEDRNSDGTMETYSYGKRMVKPTYTYYNVSIEGNLVEGQVENPVGICTSCLSVVRDTGHPLANYDGNIVGYSVVKERFGENGENGYVIHEFENERHVIKPYNYQQIASMATVNVDYVPVKPPSSCWIKNPGNGDLKKQTYFSATGVKVRRVDNQYVHKYKRVKYGVAIQEISVTSSINASGQKFGYLMPYESITSLFSHLSLITDSTFSPLGIKNTHTTTTKFYDKPEHLQLTKQVTQKSDGGNEIIKYSYPMDYTDAQSNAAILQMKGTSFMHAFPIEATVIDERGGVEKVKQKEIAEYGIVNSKVLLTKNYVFKNQTLVDLGSVPAYTPSQTISNAYEKKFTIDYTAEGNVSRTQKDSDLPTSYLWGYGNTQPVAEIVNANPGESFYSSFEDDGEVFMNLGVNAARTGRLVRGSGTYTFPATYTPAEANTLMSYWYWANSQWNFSGEVPFQRTITQSGANKLDEVRAFPVGARMTTYAFDPRSGLSSTTDINNITTFYEYDWAGRLKLVRDNDKRILKSYEYSYKKMN